MAYINIIRHLVFPVFGNDGCYFIVVVDVAAAAAAVAVVVVGIIGNQTRNSGQILNSTVNRIPAFFSS